jgi:hypothetical protein
MNCKTTLPNTELQRIQPNEVQIPQVFVGLENVEGSRSDDAVASLSQKVGPQDPEGEQGVSVPHGWCAGHEDGGHKNEEGAEEGRGEREGPIGLERRSSHVRKPHKTKGDEGRSRSEECQQNVSRVHHAGYVLVHIRTYASPAPPMRRNTNQRRKPSRASA